MMFHGIDEFTPAIGWTMYGHGRLATYAMPNEAGLVVIAHSSLALQDIDRAATQIEIHGLTYLKTYGSIHLLGEFSNDYEH